MDLIPLPKMSEFLIEEFIEPMGLTESEVSEGAGVPLNELQLLLADKQELTLEQSEKLGAYFGVSSILFYDIQRDLKERVAVNAKIRKQKKEEFVECYKTVMDVMGLPLDDDAVATEDNGSSGTGAVYLTVEEAAKIMEQSRRAVRHYCGNGILAGAKKVELYRKGKLDWLIPYASVEALLEHLDRPSKLKKAVTEV